MSAPRRSAGGRDNWEQDESVSVQVLQVSKVAAILVHCAWDID